MVEFCCIPIVYIMKTIIYSTKDFERPYFERLNNGRHVLYYIDALLNPDTVYLAEGFEAVCIFVHDEMNADTIKRLSQIGIKLIALRCTGYNNIDIKAAKTVNIKVVHVPAYSPQAVAEHAVALIMALTRKTHKAYNRVRENNFLLENLLGFNLYGKTVGIIGMGKIGEAFGKIMLGFGCRVIAYDIQHGRDVPEEIAFKSFDEILQLSDIISIHCPLTPATRYLFNKETFSKMKKGSMLINTGRGGIVNTLDAIEALKNGLLGYLGIDVYENEEALFFKDLSAKIIKDDTIERLICFHNVIVTPHQAFFTHEALEEIVNITLKNLSDFATGLDPKNQIE